MLVFFSALRNTFKTGAGVKFLPPQENYDKRNIGRFPASWNKAKPASLSEWNTWNPINRRRCLFMYWNLDMRVTNDFITDGYRNISVTGSCIILHLRHLNFAKFISSWQVRVVGKHQEFISSVIMLNGSTTTRHLFYMREDLHSRRLCHKAWYGIRNVF